MERDFCHEARTFLAFVPRYIDLGKEMAAAITVHSFPVGSGTAARTEMIPVEETAAKNGDCMDAAPDDCL